MRVRTDGKFFARGEQRFRVQGVTYGPFAPSSEGLQFPSPQQVRADFKLMRAAAINSIRTYHAPPAWMFDCAEESGISVFVDIPWGKHLCFLDSQHAQAEARRAVQTAVRHANAHPAILAFSIANEIPPNIVRWHGARRVERFLCELADLARQANPLAPITYANYPPTEYLDLSFTDFVTFNVYLHEGETFRRYLHRLQNIVGDKPLLLGELGMDTLRHSEWEQADFLDGHLRETTLTGLAGAFVFSWTDDWHTGGHQIDDWAFGVTDRVRNPKRSYHAVGEVFHSTPATLLKETPRVSVVVCSYNGGATLEQCLRSLQNVDYPDYEVIVVDDGSTDHTPAILQKFPSVHTIRQANAGLSAARNVGLYAATGSLIAYTDSDCFVDREWLSLLVDRFLRTDAAAVGGPNLSPDDGWLASCVAASPGQPMHVLESDQVAEHIPGCNMAFRREALLAINGFDHQYRKAGDDVDICWRLQQAGYWLTFAPGAFVWHHRRQTPRSYLRQQAGYGEAESLLRFQHPDRFNGRGDGRWNGVLYGASLQGLRLEKPLIYHGKFATGLFQTIYQPGPAHWAMLPGSLEWHLAMAICCLAIPAWPPMALIVLVMWLLSVAVAGLQAAQASLPAKYDGGVARAVVMFLCYSQPLVRSWHRQRTRLFGAHCPCKDLPAPTATAHRVSLLGRCSVDYWSEAGLDRCELLDNIVGRLRERGWSKTLDTGWENWDVAVFCHPWAVARIATAQEDHANNRRLIRVRYRVRPSGYTQAIWFLAAVLGIWGITFSLWNYAGVAVVLSLTAPLVFGIGIRRAESIVALVDSIALDLSLIPCGTSPFKATADAPTAAETDREEETDWTGQLQETSH